MAGAVELLHLAALIHDDTVDDSDLRRGKATVSNRWGKHVAVLFGDYVFATSATFVCDTNNITGRQAFLRDDYGAGQRGARGGFQRLRPDAGEGDVQGTYIQENRVLVLHRRGDRFYSRRSSRAADSDFEGLRL